MSDREELEALRRLVELEAKARGAAAPYSEVGPSPSINPEALADTIKDVPRLAGQGAMQTVQGFMDMPVGAAQLVSKVIPGQGAENAVADYMRSREKAYAPLTGADERPGELQPGRIGGNVVAGVAMSPDKNPVGIWNRMVSGSKVGGGMGLLAPVDPDNQNFWTTKAATAGVSAGMGFLAPAVMEGIFRGASAAANWLGGRAQGSGKVITGQTRPAEIESTLTIELQRNGVDWSKLPQQMRDQLVGEVQTALKSGGELDPDAVRRLADFAKLGIKPTQGQVTRHPYAWGNEKNLGKTELGAPLAERFNEQNTQMIGVLDGARSGLTRSPDLYATGEGAIGSLRGVGQRQKGVVDTAYGQARDHLGRAAPMDAAAFSRDANLALDEGMLGHYLPAEVRNILNDVTGGKIPFNVNTAVQIDSTLSAAQRAAGEGTPQSIAIGRVRDALNKAPIADNVGAEAKAAFDTARGLAAKNFANRRATPALDDVMDRNAQLSPEKFIEQYFVRGDVNSVKNVMGQMPPEGRAEVQAGVMDWIKKLAVLGDGDTATISAAGLKKALDTIGDRKLGEIFAGSDVLEQLNTLRRVSAYVNRAPISTGANWSGSATTMIDALDKMGRLPIVGALMGKPGDFIRATQVAKSLSSPAPVTEAAPMIADETVNTWAPRVGLLGAPAAGALPSAFFRPPVVKKEIQNHDNRR